MQRSTILHILLYLAITFTTTAQSSISTQSGLRIEPIIGFQTAALIETGNFFPQDKTREIAYGILLDYKFSSRWGIQSGLILQETGGNFDFSGDNINGDPFSLSFTVDAKHLTIPLNINYYFGQKRLWHIDLGLNYNVSISDSTLFVNCATCDFFESLDNFYGANVFIGYEIAIGRNSIHLRSGASSSIHTLFENVNPLIDISQVLILSSIGYKLKF